MYLLDTNVLSEIRKPPKRANKNVVEWVASRSIEDFYLSSITIFEIELGIRRLRRKDEVQAARLSGWLEQQVLVSFEDRILPVDTEVARTAAKFHVPDPKPERDVLIGTTALVNGLSLVTRNTADFDVVPVSIINPWLLP